MLTGRGSELQREIFSPILNERNMNGLNNIRILLPVPKPTTSEYDWTSQREHELASFDRAYQDGILSTQIETTIQFLKPYLKDNKVNLKLYNYPHIGRILLTDRAVFFTVYQNDSHGRDSKVIKYNVRGEMYNSLQRLFNQLWEASQLVIDSNK